MATSCGYKYGWGLCPKCHRVIASTKFGKAYHHGHSKIDKDVRCAGSGELLGRIHSLSRKVRLI